jgi:hypothetical protein
VVGIAVGLNVGRPVFDSWKQQGVFLFSTRSGQLWSHPSSIQWVLWVTRFIFGNVFKKIVLYIMSKNAVEPEAADSRAHARWYTISSTHTHLSIHSCTHTLARAHTQKYVKHIVLHSNNGFMNAPRRYVIRTLPVLLAGGLDLF